MPRQLLNPRYGPEQLAAMEPSLFSPCQSPKSNPRRRPRGTFGTACSTVASSLGYGRAAQ